MAISSLIAPLITCNAALCVKNANIDWKNLTNEASICMKLWIILKHSLVFLFLWPFQSIILQIKYQLALAKLEFLEFDNNDENKYVQFKKLTTDYETEKARLFEFQKVEKGTETCIQLTMKIIFLAFASSHTRTSQGLVQIFR